MSDLEDKSPGAAFEIFLKNESLMEKLKLLDFETQFVQKGLRPISKITFSIQNKENQGEQFTQFTKLSEFLLRQNGLQLEIDEFDDPGQIISQIMEHCRRLSGSVNVDFPPQKLRPGYGFFVTELLYDLAEAALKTKGHKFRRPEYPTESDDTEQAIEESDPEVDMEDDVDGDYSDDENDILQLNQVEESPLVDQTPIVKDLPKVDPEAWKEEVERLAPQLKITLRPDQKNWRQRIDQLKQNREQIESLFGDTGKQLITVSDEIGSDMDKTKSREKYINQQLESLITELRTSHDKLAQAKETYNNQTSGIAEKTNELSEISAQLESIKNEMEERGQMISDGKPIQQAKKAIAQLTKENCELDVRIAVIEHEISQQSLKMAQATH